MCRSIWLAKWSEREYAEPAANDILAVKAFMHAKYTAKRWFSSPIGAVTALKKAPESQSASVVTNASENGSDHSSVPLSGAFRILDSPSKSSSNNQAGSVQANLAQKVDLLSINHSTPQTPPQWMLSSPFQQLDESILQKASFPLPLKSIPRSTIKAHLLF